MREKWLRSLTDETLLTILKNVSTDAERMRAELRQRRLKGVKLTMNCKCGWGRSGLGAEVENPSVDCLVHGPDGPLPMFNSRGERFDRPDRGNDPSIEQVAGMLAAKHDDRHAFTSGAMSSGRKPDYAEMHDRITHLCLERFTAQRRYGDTKYGKDNWKQGARDKEFILDRINHGIEHLLNLHRQVTNGDPGNWEPGHDDAAAVACCAMFVMEWQKERRADLQPKSDPRVGGGPTYVGDRKGSLNEGFGNGYPV